jgi:hypothetical protein
VMPLLTFHSRSRPAQRPLSRGLSLAGLAMGVAAFAATAAVPASAAPARVGDAGSKPDPAKFDPAYPDMKEWAEAGVRGGIPARDALPVRKTLKPGDDVQAAVDEAGKAVADAAKSADPAGPGGAVVLLSAGTYRVGLPIVLRSGVVLRGADRSAVFLDCTIRSARVTDTTYVVRLPGVRRAGLEDLTVRHAEVARLGSAAYAERTVGPVNNPGGAADLHVGGVLLDDAEDCWVDGVNILHSGSHPLEASGKRVTVRDTVMDGAFNKGDAGAPAGSGNVYFAVSGGLMFNCTVSNVRHCLVVRDTLAGGDCKFNVFLDCNFTGDVNFHGNRRDSGHNLFEGVFVRSLTSHGWPAWAYWKGGEIGQDNLMFRSAGWGGSAADKFASTDASKVYTFTGMKDPNVLPPLDKPAPAGGTLYAVTGERATADGRATMPTAVGAWPKMPGEARDLMAKRTSGKIN